MHMLLDWLKGRSKALPGVLFQGETPRGTGAARAGNSVKADVEKLRGTFQLAQTRQARERALLAERVNRSIEGRELERAGDEDGATALYEANVSDRFAGSHPYERLLAIYARSGRTGDVRRIAEACLTHANAGLDDALRAQCVKALAHAHTGPH